MGKKWVVFHHVHEDCGILQLFLLGPVFSKGLVINCSRLYSRSRFADNMVRLPVNKTKSEWIVKLEPALLFLRF